MIRLSCILYKDNFCRYKFQDTQMAKGKKSRKGDESDEG